MIKSVVKSAMKQIGTPGQAAERRNLKKQSGQDQKNKEAYIVPLSIIHLHEPYQENAAVLPG